MLLHVPEVLSAQEVASLRSALEGADWSDGAWTAGGQAARVKQNRQLAADAPGAAEMGEAVRTAMLRHPLFRSAALPRTVLMPRFNRYEGGGHYGNHIDSAVHHDPFTGNEVRTDVSTTLFLNDPAEYDGGELIIEDTYGTHEVKLKAGDAILYPATSLHRVEPVTRGTRLASFFWTQSLVRDDTRRAMLFQLDMAILSLRQKLSDTSEIVALTGHYHNLLRQWAEV